jgi:hypothetical protein
MDGVRNRLFGPIGIAFGLLCASLTFGQSLVVTDIRVHDPSTPETTTCQFAPDQRSPFRWKGDGDGALSPGERVRLDIYVSNQTGEDITFLKGSLSSGTGIYHINIHCQTGEFGAVWSCPIAPGAVASSFDPFYMDIPQGMECLEDVTFSLYLTWTTASGTSTQTYEFTLPFFSFMDPATHKQKAFLPSPETPLFPSSADQSYPVAASGGKEIGIFFNRPSGIQLGKLDLDGNIMKDPENTGYGGSSESVALYNTARTADGAERYELIYWNGYISGPIYALYKDYDIGTWTQKSVTMSGQPISMAGKPIAAVYNPTRNEIAILFTDRDPSHASTYGHVMIARVDPIAFTVIPAVYPDVNPMDLGVGDMTSTLGGRCGLAYLEAKSARPSAYYAVYERYVDNAYPIPDEHSLQLFRINDATLGILNSASVTLTGEAEALPSMAIDPGNEWVAVAYQDAGTPKMIWGSIFRLDLVPAAGVSSTQVMVTLPPGTDATQPELVFFRDFILGWRKFNAQSASSGWTMASQFRVNLGGGSSLWTEVQTSPLSDEWFHLSGPRGLMGLDRAYFFWSDQRSSMEYPWGLRVGMARPIDPRLPANLDQGDDVIVSQAYERARHPSLATKGSEFLAAWTYRSQVGGGPGVEIWGRTVSDEGALGSKFVISNQGQTEPNEANPIALVHNSQYEVFWMSQWATLPDPPYTGEGHFFRYVQGGSYPNPAPFHTYASNSARLLSAAAQEGGSGEALVYLDRKSGDSVDHLYLYAAGAPEAIRLTEPVATLEAYDAAVCYDPGATDGGIWAVVWSEKRSTGRKVYLARYDLGLTLVGIVQELDTNASGVSFHREVEIAASPSRLFVLLITTDYGGMNASMVLKTFASNGAYMSEQALASAAVSYDTRLGTWNPPFYRLRLRYELGQATVSYLIRSDVEISTMYTYLYYFLYEKLDSLGSRTHWPQRLASFPMRTFDSQFAYEVCPTSRGGAAAYNFDTVTAQSNIWLAMLGWPEGYPYCHMYNEPPVVKPPRRTARRPRRPSPPSSARASPSTAKPATTILETPSPARDGT